MVRVLVVIVLVGACVAVAPATASAQEQVDRGPKRRYVPFEVTIVPPINLFHFRRKVVIGVSVNALYGKAAAVYGIEVGGLVNRETEGFGGLQVAGIANWVSGRCAGIQASLVNYCRRGGALQLGAFNAGGDGLSAIQLAAGGNYADSMPFGIQVSPILNNVLKDFRGLQISLMNFDGQSLPRKVGDCGYNCEITETTVYPGSRARGIMIGLGNLAQNLRGVQIGMINSGARSVGGIQLGALMNLGGRTSGLQVAPFNIAGDVKGIQIGVVNVARRLKGVQIGALNIAYKNPLPVMVGINAGF